MKEIDQAMDAKVRIHVFGAIQSILEGGAMSGGSASADKAAAEIIAICRKEQQKQLRIMDAAVKSLEQP